MFRTFTPWQQRKAQNEAKLRPLQATNSPYAESAIAAEATSIRQKWLNKNEQRTPQSLATQVLPSVRQYWHLRELLAKQSLRTHSHPSESESAFLSRLVGDSYMCKSLRKGAVNHDSVTSQGSRVASSFPLSWLQ